MQQSVFDPVAITDPDSGALAEQIERFGHRHVEYIGPLSNAANRLKEIVQPYDLVYEQHDYRRRHHFLGVERCDHDRHHSGHGEL